MDQRSTGAVLGADEYIVKPVDKSILLAAVERCLGLPASVDAGQSILVVEDDAPTRELIVDMLSRHGYALDTAADGLLAKMRVQKSLPDLVILDLILPEMSGFALIAEWRRSPRTAHLPIFVLTNKDLSWEEKEYLNTHTGALISKHGSWREELVRHVQRTAPQTVEAQ
jgi:DNA-binding response OmpR family regulator